MTLTNKKMLALFLLMMGVFMVLAIRSEINSEAILRNSTQIEMARKSAAYQSCLNGVEILTKFNTAQQALADQEKDSIAEDPNDSLGLNSRRQNRIDIYETSLVPLPDCDTLKP